MMVIMTTSALRCEIYNMEVPQDVSAMTCKEMCRLQGHAGFEVAVAQQEPL